MSEKSPGPPKRINKKTFGSIMKSSNEGPFDRIAKDDKEGWATPFEKYEEGHKEPSIATPEPPSITIDQIERSTLRVQGAREAIELRRKAFEEETAREAKQARIAEDKKSLIEDIALLQTEAIRADAAGDSATRDKLIEVIRSLKTKNEKLGGSAAGKSVAEQMAEHGIFGVPDKQSGSDLESLLKKLAEKNKEQHETHANGADSEARIEKLRRELGEQSVAEATPLLERLATKNKKHIEAQTEKELPTVLQEIKKKNAAKKEKAPKTEPAAEELPEIVKKIKAINGAKKERGTAWEEHFGGLAEGELATEAAKKKEAEEAEKKSQKDIEEWKKHFGVLAETQGEPEKKDTEKSENEATEEKKWEELSPEDWKKEKEDIEAAKRKTYPQEEKKWEEWSPEDWKKEVIESKKLREAAAAALGTRDEDRVHIVNTDPTVAPQERNKILQKISAAGKAYRALPTWRKALIGGTLLGLGVAGAWFGGPAAAITWGAWAAQRALTSLGAFTMVGAATERMKNRYVAGVLSGGAAVAGMFLPSSIQYLDQHYLHVGDYVRDFLGFQKAGTAIENRPVITDADRVGKGDLPPKPVVVEPEELSVNPAPNETPTSSELRPSVVVAPPSIEQLFGQKIVVTENDRLRGLWGILEQKLTDGKIINANTAPHVKNYIIDSIEKELDRLGPDKLKNLGFKSGNINVIRPGEQLDLRGLPEWINKFR